MESLTLSEADVTTIIDLDDFSKSVDFVQSRYNCGQLEAIIAIENALEPIVNAENAGELAG